MQGRPVVAEAAPDLTVYSGDGSQLNVSPRLGTAS